MKVLRTLKIVGGWSAAILIVFGYSYFSEAPKYRFEHVAILTGQQIPGARLVSSVKSTDLTSPVSWFWPTTTAMSFALPDPLMDGRFYVMSLLYEYDDPNVILVDADCHERSEEFYELGMPDSALPALDLWGQPVVAPNGQT